MELAGGCFLAWGLCVCFSMFGLSMAVNAPTARTVALANASTYRAPAPCCMAPDPHSLCSDGLGQEKVDRVGCKGLMR